jgi:hypothetical protein
MLSRLLALAGVALAVAAVTVDRGSGSPAPPPAPARVAAGVGPTAPVREPPHVRTRARVAPPVRIRIPAIGVDARVARVGLDHAGALEVPSGWDDAGWYVHGPRPGEPGPAVIVGHVDSTSGPAVFYRLGGLRPGATIRVVRQDGSAVSFRVHRVGRWPKDGFPTRLVYGATRRPTLRLITCGGAFDPATGHYLDNTVVFANPA